VKLVIYIWTLTRLFLVVQVSEFSLSDILRLRQFLQGASSASPLFMTTLSLLAFMRIVPRFLAKSFIFARLMMTATMSASIDWNRSVSQCSHLGSHSGSDSVADVSPSASFPGVNISSMCHWHVKEIMTTFAHHFSVILAHFREVFPWIVYTIPVSLHVEHHSSSNVRVDSDSRRLCVPAKTHPWSRGCSYWVRMTLQGWVEWGGMLLVFVFIHAGRKTALTVVAVAHSW
jgi:hypothetical protein